MKKRKSSKRVAPEYPFDTKEGWDFLVWTSRNFVNHDFKSPFVL